MFVAVYKSVHNVQCALVRNLVSQFQACTVLVHGIKTKYFDKAHRWSTASTNK